MNSTHLHLALSHVPVILSLTGMVILAYSMVKNSSSLIKTSFVVLLLSGLAALPVYLTGEGTEEMVEQLPGVTEAVIERHEELALLATISIVATGALALIGLILFERISTSRIIQRIVLLLALVSGGLLAQTANFGGQVRHSEIRKDSSVQTEHTKKTDTYTGNSKQSEETED